MSQSLPRPGPYKTQNEYLLRLVHYACKGHAEHKTIHLLRLVDYTTTTCCMHTSVRPTKTDGLSQRRPHRRSAPASPNHSLSLLRPSPPCLSIFPPVFSLLAHANNPRTLRHKQLHTSPMPMYMVSFLVLQQPRLVYHIIKNNLYKHLVSMHHIKPR